MRASGRIARVVVLTGLSLFALRGVLAAAPPETRWLLPAALAALFWAADSRLVAREGRRIGELACREGWLTADCVERILRIQRSRGGRFGEIARAEAYLSLDQVERLLALGRGGRLRGA